MLEDLMWEAVKSKASQKGYFFMQNGAPPHCTNIGVGIWYVTPLAPEYDLIRYLRRHMVLLDSSYQSAMNEIKL